MSTGMESLTKLSDMAEIYPFAGFEPLYAAVALVFFVVFIAKQIAMDKQLHEEMLDHTSEAMPTPAE